MRSHSCSYTTPSSVSRPEFSTLKPCEIPNGWWRAVALGLAIGGANAESSQLRGKDASASRTLRILRLGLAQRD